MKIKVWDPAVRVVHWALAAGFVMNAFLDAAGKPLHRWIGYAMAALVAFRILWGFVGPRHARFSDFLPSPGASLAQAAEMAAGRRTHHAGHSPLGALMIYNLLLCILALGLTGWMQGTDAYFGVKWVKEVHEMIATWAQISVGLHIAAVLFESRRLGVNLPLSMVTGYKVLPEPNARPE